VAVSMKMAVFQVVVLCRVYMVLQPRRQPSLLYSDDTVLLLHMHDDMIGIDYGSCPSVHM
jgi:hypothetical protein